MRLRKGFVGRYKIYKVFVESLRPLKVIYSDGVYSYKNTGWTKKELIELHQQYLQEHKKGGKVKWQKN
jgi:hypothetical protein